MLLKNAAGLLDNKDMLAIRARHITLRKRERNFYAPREQFEEILHKPAIIKHAIVIDGDVAYTYLERGAKKLLDKLGIEVNEIRKVGFRKMQNLLETVNSQTDTVIGHLFRHPIIGYVGVGTIKPANIHGIGVPADIAEKLDGDDDGDLIDLIPGVILKNRKMEFATTILDL